MQLGIDVASAVSVCVELLLYGVFLNLFIMFLAVVIKRRATRTRSSQFFLFGSCMMFAVATTHAALNLYRLLKGYVYLRDIVGPVAYFSDLSRPENVASDVINAVMTWLGDALAIYRCYLIWENNIYIVILPILLMIVSIVSNGVAIHYFVVDPFISVFSPSLTRWINTLYVVALLQNIYTTVFIAYRVYREEKAFRAAGIRRLSMSANFMPIARIVVESASGYTAILIVLIVLYAINHNGQFIVQEMTVPCVGIVFTLITVRLALRNSKAVQPTTDAETSISTNVVAWAVPSGLNSTGMTTELLSLPGHSQLSNQPSSMTYKYLQSSTSNSSHPHIPEEA